MNEWKKCTLGEICNYVNSRANNYANYISTENMLPNKGGISDSNIIPTGNVTEYNAGDVLISNIRPYFQKIWYATKNGGCSNDVLCVRATEMVDNKYLYYLLSQQSFFDYVMTGAKGCKMPRGDKKQIMQWEICLPPFDEQKRIASILSALDDQIELNRRINENLEQQAQALFKHWFVDFEFPNTEGKPYKSTGGKLVDLELGAIPEGWKVLPIEHLAEKIASGGTPQSLNQSYYEGNIKWFTTKELKDCFLFDSEKHISADAVVNSSAKPFPAYSVLMALYGVTATKLGILQNSATFNQAAVGIIPQKDIGYAFIYLTLLSERSNLNNLASGAAQQNLNVRIVKSYKVVIPPLSLLNSFNLIANSYFEQIKYNTIVNVNTAQLRDTLLPKLMSGKLNIEEYV